MPVKIMAWIIIEMIKKVLNRKAQGSLSAERLHRIAGTIRTRAGKGNEFSPC